MGFHLGGHAPLPAAVNLQEGAFTRSAILRAGRRVLQQQYALRSVVRGHSLLNPPCVASLEIPRDVFVSYYFYLIKSAKRGRAHRAVVRLRLEIISGRWRLLLLGDVEDHLQPDVHVHDEMAVEVPHAGVVSDEAQNSVLAGAYRERVLSLFSELLIVARFYRTSRTCRTRSRPTASRRVGACCSRVHARVVSRPRAQAEGCVTAQVAPGGLQYGAP